MKVTIEIDPALHDTEVVIHCSKLDDSIVNLQNRIVQQNNGSQCLSLYNKDTQYYIPVNTIYFFETEGKEILAHTRDKIFHTQLKLYELEAILPSAFMRISKSTIANLDYIYSITRNLTASSMIAFADSRKTTLVSRSYYKALTEQMAIRRLGQRNL